VKTYNVYLTGVGGQGIGLLSEILLRAVDHGGLKVKGVDTHGLAQRGGIVVSHLRVGEHVYSPLISAGCADIVVSLERHEALRGMNSFLKDGGVLLYYDAVWQPLEVRLNLAKNISNQDIATACLKRNIKAIRVFKPDLEDVRMQNIVLLAHIYKNNLIPELDISAYTKAMSDLMEEKMLSKNMNLFDAVSSSS
jgi:indolepyruvate ferredoxin oxidoreductase beta subunit